jgi:aspartate/tyrosine/aromatic aminotransferase
MTELSPAAQAVLTAVTLTKYDVPPEGLPAFAEEMAPLLAAALRAAALHLRAEEVETCGGASYALVIEVDDLIAIADELEAPPGFPINAIY